MITITQCQKNARIPKRHLSKCPALKGCPQKRATVLELRRDLAPKKPNSAKRQCAQVELNRGRKVIVYIPGKGSGVQKHMDVLIRGGRVPDLPGVKYHIMRYKLDFQVAELQVRRQRRSKYGLKKIRLDNTATEANNETNSDSQ